MAASQQVEVDRVSSSHSSSFVCQKCGQPLKLDSSFYAVDQKAFNELTGISGIRIDAHGIDRLITDFVSGVSINTFIYLLTRQCNSNN